MQHMWKLMDFLQVQTSSEIELVGEGEDLLRRGTAVVELASSGQPALLRLF